MTLRNFPAKQVRLAATLPIWVCLVIVLALAAGGAPAKTPKKPKTAKSAKSSKSQHQLPTENIFTNAEVLRIEVEIPEAGLQTLRDYRWEGFGGGRQEKRPSVKATVREGGKTYTDVAVHLKGAAGSFRPIDDNPALTLNFDKNVKGQTFHGLERISLNNSVQDRSLLNEKVCRELFATAGIPVPRATPVKVKLNGRDLGVYVLTEAFNKQFLAEHFKNPNGNLYDGGFLKDVTDDLEKSSGPNPEDRSDLKRLAQAAMESNPTNRLAQLNKLLNLDQFITYLALDVLMADWDGYGLNRNNYRLYHDPDSDKIVFMPHGLDQMFGAGMRATPSMTIFPRMSGLVARAVLQTAEGRQRYRNRLSELMTSLYHVPALTNHVWELAGQVRPVLAEKGPQTVRAYEGEVAEFCERIVQRAESVRHQLNAPDKALAFDSSGVARMAEWQPKAQFGHALLDELAEGGKKLLHVSATNGSCVGVWSTRLRLEPGQYRLEGKIKTVNVTPDPGDRKGGAGLRISGRTFKQKVTGTADWTDMAFEFDTQQAPSQFGFMGPIEEDLPDLELICELRAAKGEAWFDKDSLRLIRK